MPRTGEFLFSVDRNAIRNSHALDLRSYVEGSLHAMPAWMYVALRESSGEGKCMVLINSGVDYFAYFFHFYWQSQQIERKRNPVRQELIKFGFPRNASQFGALQELICDSAKRDIDTAITAFYATSRNGLNP